MITQYIFEGKIFCYSLQRFRTADILKCHINECFKINDKQKIKMSKKVKIKSQFLIYACFESILVPEKNGVKNVNESYTSKCCLQLWL